MVLLYLYSFVFIAASLTPLWYDANQRKEYGTRPKSLLAALILFLAMGAFSAIASATGVLAGPWANIYFTVLMSVYPLLFLIVEYSVHSQRIKKNLLFDEWKKGVGIVVIFFAVTLALCILLAVLQNAPPSKLITPLTYATAALYYLAVIAFNLYGIFLFDLEEGVIRKKIYTFKYGAIIAGIALFTLVLPINIGVWIFLSTLVLNFIFAGRIFQEYFLFRMYHLNSNYMLQKHQDKVRTDLINKVLVSSPEEDVDIIQGILTSFLARIKETISNPSLRCKSMMLFRRNEDLLSVDSPKLIVDYCIPLINQETIKRMKQDMLAEHIMTQIFDLAKLKNTDNTGTLDFASAAVRRMIDEKAPVMIKPLPNFLAQLFQLIVLYPVFNKGELTSMLVVFKDSSDYIFPQEKVIIDDLLNSLSITTMLIGGKQMQEDKNRLNQEMDVAKMIQVSILPKEIGIRGYDIATEMITATEVGGDLYDFKPTQFGNFLDIGDVSGHGLPAGMMALIHMAAFHGALCASESIGKQLETTELYNIVNRVLISLNRDRMGSDKFMTCNILLERDGTFKHAGSHMVGLIYRAATDSIEELTGMVERAAYLGISEYADSSKSLGEFTLSANDVLVLYTDGLTESRNRFDEFFGLEGLGLALKTNAKLPSDGIKKAILTALETFSETGDLQKYAGNYADDVSILVIKRS
jgi:sigma-B regulation protein RsbU (phosphoserine phosphatase)